jgi:hypothetical protein
MTSLLAIAGYYYSECRRVTSNLLKSIAELAAALHACLLPRNWLEKKQRKGTVSIDVIKIMGVFGFIPYGSSSQDIRGVFSGQRSGESGNLYSKKIFFS